MVSNEELIIQALVISYAQNKRELDSYKKLCDSQNAELKQRLKAEGIDSVEAGDYIAKYVVQHRESLDEDMLLKVILRHRGEYPVGVLSTIVKTKEYVDMDGLENAIYTGMIPEEVVREMQEAYSTKEVETIKISKKGGKK